MFFRSCSDFLCWYSWKEKKNHWATGLTKFLILGFGNWIICRLSLVTFVTFMSFELNLLKFWGLQEPLCLFLQIGLRPNQLLLSSSDNDFRLKKNKPDLNSLIVTLNSIHYLRFVILYFLGQCSHISIHAHHMIYDSITFYGSNNTSNNLRKSTSV